MAIQIAQITSTVNLNIFVAFTTAQLATGNGQWRLPPEAATSSIYLYAFKTDLCVAKGDSSAYSLQQRELHL